MAQTNGKDIDIETFNKWFPDAGKTLVSPRKCVLIGNGFSTRFDDFYKEISLIENLKQFIKNKGIENEKELENLLKIFNTNNIESILEKLWTSHKTINAFKDIFGVNFDLDIFLRKHDQLKNDFIDSIVNYFNDQDSDSKRYNQIKDHIKYINLFLRRFDSVFTTNYDPTIYWSVFHTINGGKHFKLMDLFIGKDSSDIGASSDIKIPFDPYAEVFKMARQKHDASIVYYLHGAFHLVVNKENDKVFKIRSQKWELLNEVVKFIKSESTFSQLIVNEGTSENKIEAIRKNNYLSHCIDRLSSFDENEVNPNKKEGNQIETEDKPKILLLGFSASEKDEHICNAICSNVNSHIVICYWRDCHNSEEPKNAKSKYENLIGKLQNNEISYNFYDVTDNYKTYDEPLKLPCDEYLKKIKVSKLKTADPKGSAVR